MAPDLNSVPPSPYPLDSSLRPSTTSTNDNSTSRRASSSRTMPPPQLPLSSPGLQNVLPSNQSTVASHHQLPSPGTGQIAVSGSSNISQGDNAGVGAGPGPLRHPRPLTAADLHMQLEKEQEATVNRLTRELSLLRAAQNASVASNSSSTSNSTHASATGGVGAGLPDITDTNANHLLSGPSHPTPSTRRHHRSSSSTSVRSITGASSVTTANISGVAPERARERAGMTRHDSNTMPLQTGGSGPRGDLSRQNSMTSSRRSGASSPAPSEYFQYLQQQSTRAPAMHRERSSSSNTGAGGAAIGTVGSMEGLDRSTVSGATGARYEEVLYHRNELDAAKRENEALKRRIRELERMVRQRRESDASASGGISGTSVRGRSESVETNASLAGLRVRDGDAEDVVRVGESARGGG